MEKGLITQLSPNQPKSSENSPKFQKSETQVRPKSRKFKIRKILNRYPLFGPWIVFTLIIVSIILISGFAVHGKVSDQGQGWKSIRMDPLFRSGWNMDGFLTLIKSLGENHAKWSTIFLFFKMHYFISAGLLGNGSNDSLWFIANNDSIWLNMT